MATSDDDILSSSEAELDSETEDNDMEQEIDHWLEQLKVAGDNVDKIMPKRLTITAKQVMESFRNSILMDGGGDIDLDAILGDLCELEAQISNQQHDLNTNLQRSSYLSTLNTAVEKEEKHYHQQPSFSYEWDDAIDSELQGALDALSDLTGTPEGSTSSTPPATHSNTDSSANEYDNISCTLSDSYSNTAFYANSDSDTGTIKRQPSNHSVLSQNHKKQPFSPSKGHLSQPTFPTAGCSEGNNDNSNNTFLPPAGNRLSAGALGSGYQNFEQDLSPVSLEIDSAFSDSLSLPSSGSHGSVATSGSGSQHSGGSQNSGGTAGFSSGSSGVGSGADGPPISPNEQTNKLKAEKVKIALEKIKEANIKKLFVRAHTSDGCCKSILVDEHMLVAHVCDILMAKNHVIPTLSWALIEQLPDLYMERLLEDHDNLVEHMLYWARDSPNKIYFVERNDKYAMFSRPEDYLIPEKNPDEDYSEVKRDGLIKEYFNESNAATPELEGMLYLKCEGKKVWKKLFFVLRASGLYFNPKGKGKSTKDLVCLQKFDFTDIYIGIGWKKKFKAPTDYGFALKHPQIQKKTSKYIKYVCVEDDCMLKKWVAGIRIAKYGLQLKQNYETMKNNITTFNYRDVIPNPNFNEYVAKHNEVVEKYSKTGHRISKADNEESTGADFRKSSIRDSVRSSKNNGAMNLNRHSMASVTSASSRSSAGSNRSPVKVVIPPPVNNNINKNTDQLDTSSSIDMNLSVETKKSWDSLDSGSLVTDKVEHEPEVISKRSSEAFENIPSCGIPTLPVNTLTTRYITDQHAVAGTLRKPSELQQSRKIKKSSSKGSDLDINDLPPPPPDPMFMMNDEDLPPPPDDMLPPPPSSKTLEELSSHTDRANNSLHTRGQSYGGVQHHPQQPFNMNNEMLYHSVDTTGINYPFKAHQEALAVSTAVKSAPTTPKKVPPPPPPKRQPDSSTSGFNVGSTRGAPPPTAPKTSYFISDLQRVLNEKHSRVSNLEETSILPPEPPLPFQSRMELNPEPSFEDLPPPPAELLEGLRQMKKIPPPPPKRKV